MNYDREEMIKDPGFQKFISEVSVVQVGQQPVLLVEFFQVLNLLWQLYGILKGQNFVSRYFGKRKVRALLAQYALPDDRFMVLTDLRNSWLGEP
jgi:hypothetical protein